MSVAFHARIAAALSDERVRGAVRLATLHKVDSRAAAMADLRDPEGLRELAARIKQHTLDHLSRYTTEFVARLEKAGGRVHFAATAADARRIILEVAAAAAAKLAVKSKSMTTEEIHLNPALEAAGIQVVETDLGEFIVQLDRDTPSHIVTPIIHKDRRQIATAMQRELGCEYTEDPTRLTMIARAHLRDIFRRCDLGITGVNFAVAETGSICVCTNEGNGRFTMTRPRVHVALMGIEKLIPRMSDLPVFLKLLARSATGQPLTVYTSIVTGPARRARSDTPAASGTAGPVGRDTDKAGSAGASDAPLRSGAGVSRGSGDPDGPDELHVIIMDNGRSRILNGPYREILRCIRCGACLNACPVYRNIGGHAYNSVYPGPIGSLVTPLLARGHAEAGASPAKPEAAELPRASSLCGACFAACPVKIDIPRYLVALRALFAGSQPRSKRLAIRLWAWFNRSPRLYRLGQWLLRLAVRPDADGWTRRAPGPLSGWTAVRDLPPVPAETFRRLWKNESRGPTAPTEAAASRRSRH